MINMQIARRLKTSQIRLLAKIATTGQLQLAAQSLSMSQPAASRMLSEVEQLMGGAMFVRHPKGLEPTDLGQTCIRHASNIVEQLDMLETEAIRTTKGTLGSVKIGVVTGPALGLLMPTLRDFKQLTPDVDYSIEVSPSSELMRGLVENRFDFVICRVPPDYDRRVFETHIVQSEDVHLVVHPDHVLTQSSNIPLEQTLVFDWVIQDQGSPIREAVEAAFMRCNLQVPPRVTNSSSLMIALAALAETQTICPMTREVTQLLASDHISARVKTLDISEPITIPPCFIVLPKGKSISVAAERLMQELRHRLS